MRRIPCLDGLRAVAIALVIVEHVRMMTPGGTFLAWLPFDGRTGVALFFVLSGFLITMLLLDESHRAAPPPAAGAGAGWPGRIANLLLRRAVRLLPAY